MATYIVLGKFTDQRIRGVKDTTKRADAFRAMAKKAGALGNLHTQSLRAFSAEEMGTIVGKMV